MTRPFNPTLPIGWSPADLADLSASMLAAAYALHGELVDQVEGLAGCLEGSPEEADRERLVDPLQAYEAARPHD